MKKHPFAAQQPTVLLNKQEAQVLSIQTQLERASCFGHHFGRVKVNASTPSVIQPKLTIGQTKPSLQKAATDSSTHSGSSLESRLANQKGGGNPLNNEVRAFMEPRFGVDFSKVRIHTDSASVQMNQELNAQAFAHGYNVYFGAGKYNPGTSDGKHLLAHELTHVVQQTGGS